MKNIAYIYTTLAFFVYIISSSIIFLISKDMHLVSFDKKVEKLKDTFGKEILNQLSYTKLDKEISKINIDYIKQKLKKKHYMKVFNNVIIEYNKNESNYEITRKYMHNFEDIIHYYTKKYSKRDDIMKNYYAVILGEYKISNYEVSEFLNNCLMRKSIYLKISSLRSISKVGNIKNLLWALEYISSGDEYINYKIIVDILEQFSGSKNDLNSRLMSNFNEYSATIQKAIVEHLKNSEVEEYKEKMLEILTKDVSKEVKISIIKYFSDIEYKKAKYKIIDILHEDDWEYRAVCATTLGKYKDIDSIDALIDSIGDKNWYVRYNSAMSLLKYNEKNLIVKVIETNDKYSIDILFYAMFMKNNISYEEYLEISRKLEVALC